MLLEIKFKPCKLITTDPNASFFDWQVRVAAFLVAITAFAPWNNGDAAHLEDKSSSETWMEMNVELSGKLI